MSTIIYPTTNLNQIEQLRICRGDGIYVYDEDGKCYLEGLSGLWCASLGYANEELIDAITQQLRTLSYSQLFGGRTHQRAIDLADELASMVPVDDARIFFANSGSEANDSHVKMLRYYFNVIGKPQKKKIIAFEKSYHGVTVASASLTGLPAMHAHFDLPTKALGVLRTATPHYYHGQINGESESEFVKRLVNDVEALILREGQETIAAFIAEPVGGAAGVMVPPKGYFPALKKVLEKYDILFWADEVICGFGRTGRWFGFETYGIEPDLVTFAKAVTNGYMPLGGCLISDKIADVLLSGGGEFAHGLTYSGHPASCAAGLATLDILEETQIIERGVVELAPYFANRLMELVDHPIVGQVRVKGLFAGVELVRDKASRERLAPASAAAVYCRDTAITQGLMVRQTGDAMIMAPPCVTERSELDFLIDQLAIALDKTAQHYGVTAIHV